MKLKADNVKRTVTLLPSIILIGVFVYGFIGETIWVSLTDWGGEAALAVELDTDFVGLRNYRELFSGIVNFRFRQDIINTFTYMVLIIAGAIAIGLVTAVVLDREPAGRNGIRTVFLYPMALSFIVSGTIWRWLLAPNGGVNLIPTLFGLERSSFRWLSSRESILQFNWQDFPRVIAGVVAVGFAIRAIRFATRSSGVKRPSLRRRLRALIPGGVGVLLFAWALIGWPKLSILSFEETHGVNLATLGVVLAAVWQYSGYTMALFVAGFGGIPVAIHDSAVITGATEFQYYTRIAIPMLSSTVMSAIIILSHISLKIFALIFAMAGPDNAQVGHPAVLMYLTTFRANNFAAGAAISVVLLLISSLFIIPYVLSSHRERRAG
jgi:glucose/mannose transport system permease protein